MSLINLKLGYTTNQIHQQYLPLAWRESDKGADVAYVIIITIIKWLINTVTLYVCIMLTKALRSVRSVNKKIQWTLFCFGNKITC